MSPLAETLTEPRFHPIALALAVFSSVKLWSELQLPSFRFTAGLCGVRCQSVGSTTLYYQSPAATVHLSLWICPPTDSINPKIQQHNWTRCSLLTGCYKKTVRSLIGGRAETIWLHWGAGRADQKARTERKRCGKEVNEIKQKSAKRVKADR